MDNSEKEISESIKEYYDIAENPNTSIDKLKESLEHQDQFIPPETTSPKPKFKDDILQERIDEEVKDLQVLAGLTAIERKILFAKLEQMKNDFENPTAPRKHEADIAQDHGFSITSLWRFNRSPVCLNALLMCSKIVIKSFTPELYTQLWRHGQKSWQPVIKLLEIIDQYTQKLATVSENKNLNINLNTANQSPQSILTQMVIKLGAVGYDKQRLINEVSEIFDKCKNEGAF